MESSELNERVRTRLEIAEQISPGTKGHADRVAVYSVAVGQRLGMDVILLISLRVTAQLNELDPSNTDLDQLKAKDRVSQQIVALCSEFDRKRTGYRRNEGGSEEEAIAWLDAGARQKFPTDMVEALLAVQSLIQPIGT